MSFALRVRHAEWGKGPLRLGDRRAKTEGNHNWEMLKLGCLVTNSMHKFIHGLCTEKFN